MGGGGRIWTGQPGSPALADDDLNQAGPCSLLVVFLSVMPGVCRHFVTPTPPTITNGLGAIPSLPSFIIMSDKGGPAVAGISALRLALSGPLPVSSSVNFNNKELTQKVREAFALLPHCAGIGFHFLRLSIAFFAPSLTKPSLIAYRSRHCRCHPHLFESPASSLSETGRIVGINDRSDAIWRPSHSHLYYPSQKPDKAALSSVFLI